MAVPDGAPAQGVGTPGTAAASPGSQAALRMSNEQRVIDLLTEIGAATQIEISTSTGLSAATVSNIVKSMTERGVVTTTPTTRSGRRAMSVRLNTMATVAVGMDFGRRHVRIALASYHRTLIDERSVELPARYRAADALTTAAGVLDDLIRDNQIDQQAVLGVGVGVPGALDRRTWTVIPGGNLPEWEDVAIADLAAAHLPYRVHLDTDVNVGTLAQVTWGKHQHIDNLVFIKIGHGIGCGLYVNGAPYYGHIGATGGIGHAAVDPHGTTCRCGNRGCLETIASTAKMIERLEQASGETLTVADIVRNAKRGDPATHRVLEDAGLAVGRALAYVVNLINPGVIVVGGPLAELDEVLLGPIRRGVSRNALPIVGETTAVEMSPLGEQAEALGAAALVFQQSGTRSI